MADLSAFAITRRWPAQNPDILQLYSFPTANGVKISIALEEIGLPYEVHRVTPVARRRQKPRVRVLNPNGKIPAIIDPNGPDGTPIGLFESGAILLYLADKSGKLLPENANARYETLSWLMFQMGGIGPMFGQIGYFHKFAGSQIEDPRPKQRYINEAKRLLGVLDQRLDGRDWIMGDAYTIADIATFPWVHGLNWNYRVSDLVEMDRYRNVNRWLEAALERPASKVGLVTPPRE